MLATLTFLAGCGLSRDAFAPPGTVGGPSDDRTFHIIPVHFATDRARKTSPPMGVDYTGKRGDGVLEYGVAEVSVPVNHLMGSIERPRWWRLEFSEHPDRHIVVLATRTESREAFVQDLRQAISDRGRREALVFIHG